MSILIQTVLSQFH